MTQRMITIITARSILILLVRIFKIPTFIIAITKVSDGFLGYFCLRKSRQTVCKITKLVDYLRLRH